MTLFALLALLLASTPGPDLSGHTVVLSVDDGHRSVYENVFPLLRKHRMTMTLALIVNTLGKGPTGYGAKGSFLSVAEVREMIDSCGIEIASHTLSHPWLTRLDSAQAWHEISRSKAILESLFQTRVITFVYPYGAMNSRVRNMVKKAGYHLARAVRRGDPNFWVDPYRLPEFELRIETSLASAQEYIRSHQVTILLLHRIVPEPKLFTEWPVDSFAALLDWLDKNGARTVTLARLYEEWRQQNLSRMIQGEIKPKFLNTRDLFQKVDIDATKTSHPR